MHTPLFGRCKDTYRSRKLKDRFRHFQNLHVQLIQTLPAELSRTCTPAREVLCCCSVAAGTETNDYDTVSPKAPDFLVAVGLKNQTSAMLLIMHKLFICHYY